METDYRALGLKCGLECHQQLDTGKLFSRTPSILRDDAPHYKIKRRLRPVVSEFGEHDRAALEAFEKGLYYIYEGYTDAISLVELDEEPPQPIDNEALSTILEVLLLCNSSIIDEMYIMRKMVIDGSNTSGFQRTMLVATGGSIKLQNKELGIQTIVLEEDSARPMEKTDKYISYRVDRLGVPLIELATEPTIETPKEAKEAARAIGNIFRLTGKVKRGLGTIRQDLNISIKGGARVEIKGVQELEIIDLYVEREVERQQKLLQIKDQLKQRGFNQQNYSAKEVNTIFENTESKLLKNSISKGEKIVAAKLEKFNGILGLEIQPQRRLGTELAEQVKTKTGLRGLFQSDELPNYGITLQEVENIKQLLECKSDDAFILVAGQKEKAFSAIKAAFERAQYCSTGIPEETRGALVGGNTEYLRPLPGAARMYPETDLKTIYITEKQLAQISKNLPKSVKEREKLYAQWGLNEKHIEEMKLSNFARLFEKSVQNGADARKTAVLLLEGIVEARRDGAITENLNEKTILEFIELITSGRITKEIQKEILIIKSKNPSITFDTLLENMGAREIGKNEVEETIQKIVEKNGKIVKEKGMNSLPALMGDAMKEMRGKLSGKEVSELVRKEIQKQVK